MREKPVVTEDIAESCHGSALQNQVAQIEIKNRIQNLNIESDSEEE
jgi:hypothetical protein